jgi:hypothetical protein
MSPERVHVLFVLNYRVCLYGKSTGETQGNEIQDGKKFMVQK